MRALLKEKDLNIGALEEELEGADGDLRRVGSSLEDARTSLEDARNQLASAASKGSPGGATPEQFKDIRQEINLRELRGTLERTPAGMYAHDLQNSTTLVGCTATPINARLD